MSQFITSKWLILIIVLLLCVTFGGCATIGKGISLFTKGLTLLTRGPLKIVSKIVDILNLLPKPPPGVF